MAKRVVLFLATNLAVVLTVSLILGVLLPLLGIQVGGSVWGLALFCGVFGMVGAFISLAISRWIAKRAYSIQLVEAGHPVYDMVARLARDAGLPATPEVGVYQSPEPNAFATGPRKEKALVAFSTGLLDSMDRAEIEAVAGHEISHIANGDMVTMALLMGVANALVMFLARLAAYAIDNFLRSDDRGGGLGFFGYIIVVMLLESVFMFFAFIPVAWFSRQREFRADHGAAGLTSPGAMARALQRLEESRPVRMPRENNTMALAKIHSHKRVSLWATHPSTEERVMKLQHYTG
ncbi:MAG: protease HtpX [Deltaproteobacteria bacterium]|nr:protease HtpX [Deltaproteobacteria bacterium]MBW2414251.1 protease HtpX [Deltaproteobacteria bacterium]